MMDPNATLTNLLSELARDRSELNVREDLTRREGVVDSLRTLAAWIEQGGFLPDVDEDSTTRVGIFEVGS